MWMMALRMWLYAIRGTIVIVPISRARFPLLPERSRIGAGASSHYSPLGPMMTASGEEQVNPSDDPACPGSGKRLYQKRQPRSRHRPMTAEQVPDTSEEPTKRGGPILARIRQMLLEQREPSLVTWLIVQFERPPYLERMQEERQPKNTGLLVITLILIVAAFGLSAAGLFNPSWQVVDIREFRAEHHHGLWLDCTRPERHLASMERSFAEEQPLSCTYKFDISASQVIDQNIENMDVNSAAQESEHHYFFGWHKACLICMILSLLLAAFALCAGMCAPCNGGCALLFAILVALSLFLGLVGDGIFFFAAHRVDSRFVQGLVGTYEQKIGIAFYLHLAGSVLFFCAFLMSSIYAYVVLRSSEDRGGLPIRELAPLYGSRIRETVA